MKDPVVPLERNLYGHPLAGLLWERQIEKIQLKYGWEKVSNWKCLFIQSEKGYSYLCLWMTWNWMERNKTLIRCGKYSTKKSIWENQHLCLIVYTWRALKENVKKRRYCWQLQSHVWIPNFFGVTWKTSMLREFSYLFVVLWLGRSCEEICGTILSLANKTTRQLYKVSTPCIDNHHFEKEETKSVGELSNTCSQICSEMLGLGTYWKTWYSLVSKHTCTIDYEMDQSLWQTPESIGILYSSLMWI